METAPSRLQQLLAFYEDDPTDAFTIYALATEYRETEPETAMRYYQTLLDRAPGLRGYVLPRRQDAPTPAKAR